MFCYEETNINYKYINNNSSKTLVFLHGWGQNIEMMDPIASPFEKDYNVLIVDLPGHGKSKEPSYAWDLYTHSKMLHALLTKLNIKNPVLIGHSFGGKISIIYASNYEVDRLVLLSSPYKVAMKKISLKVRILKEIAKIKCLEKIANKMKEKLGSTDYRNASGVMRNILVKHVNTDTTDLCKKIKCPTIIIWGTNDTTIDIENAYELEHLIKDCAVIPYEGCTHFAYLERKIETIKIIESFIS